jgi:alpha 1,3-glucosidase
VLYIWNDMNEPSVFSGPEITMPKTNIHAGMFEHRELHNIFGTYFHRSTFEGLLLRSSFTDRPFVLSRAFFTGASKYGAIWSGDNAAKWEYLDYSLPMALSMAVAGISFNGADVGGFFLSPSPELLVRWYQVGIFLPFFRGHAHIETKRREPWLFGEPTLSYIRKAIYDRYRLIPHFYTLFYHYSTAGLPVIRPMFLEFNNDPECAKLDRQFMLGGELLVKSIPEDKVDRINLYIPEGRWYDYWTYQDIQSGWQAVKTNPDSVPAFIRGGTVIMRKDRVRRSTQFTVNDPYSIIIALDSHGKAEGILYVDDGKSFNYKTGEFLLAKISCKENECVWEVVHDSFFSNGIERITILGLPSTAKIQLVQQSLKQECDFYSDEHSIVIRKPGVHINQNWSLVIY